MSQLSKEDIDYLRQHLVKKDLKYNPLVEEVLDHICCEIEILMESGMSFAEAYLTFSKSLEPKALKKIETETIQLVHYKLFLMKKAIYILGAISVSLFLISQVFMFMHLPGGGILFQVALLSIVGFFPLSAIYQYQKVKHTKSGRVLFSIASLLCFVVVTGFLFKVMHWPGANILLITGTMGAIFLSTTYFFYTLFQKKIKN